MQTNQAYTDMTRTKSYRPKHIFCFCLFRTRRHYTVSKKQDT